MTIEEQIMDLQTYKMHKGEDTIYVKRDDVLKVLEQEPDTWSLEDAREDFVDDVYNTLDFLPTNDEANRIIDSFDRVTSDIKQQPCENCISREAVDEYITNLLSGYLYDEERTRLEDLTAYIWELPSVTPKQKTGRWLMPQQDDGMSDPIYYQVRCSECGFDLDPQTWHMELHQYGADKYCPNCGARMTESEETE